MSLTPSPGGVSAARRTPPHGARGSLAAAVSRCGRRYRVALFMAACCAWAALIRDVHLRLEGGPRRVTGARELLDIGALPVT